MKDLLIGFHTAALQYAQHNLESWMKPSDGYVSEESRLQHIQTISELVVFHRKALEFLSGL